MSKYSIVLALAALILAFAGGFWISARLNSQPSSPVAQADPSPAPPAVQPPDLRALAAGLGGGTAAPTPEQVREELQTVHSQVAAAGEALRHIDPAERVGGAEQLAAYPTREAEALLVEALAADREPTVRQAAAQSLQAIKAPGDKTTAALLAALADESPEVGANALSALQAYLVRQDRNAARYKSLMKELQRRAKDRAIPKGIRQEIGDFIKDQTASSP
ncbi:HEAT repeat domain-containing protein [Methylomagnum sp.]